MIAVVADDITGAAELAGAGLDYGLTAEVHTAPAPGSSASLIVVDTASRSLPRPDAAGRAADAARAARAAGAAWIYKKVDSVLRGPVLAEVGAVLGAVGGARAILAPANPSRGRVIRAGQYLIDGRGLAETPFGTDPEHPVRSSRVLDLLGDAGDLPVCVRCPADDLPAHGIVVAEAESPEDLAAWARRVDRDTLPAGAADFFAAVCQARGMKPGAPQAAPDEPRDDAGALFVSGSRSGGASAYQDRGVAVLPMPPGVLDAGDAAAGAVARWAETIADALDAGPAAAVIGQAGLAPHGRPADLVERLVAAAAGALKRRPVGSVFVAGGRTASALVRRMGWSPLAARRRLAPGVVALTPAGKRRPVLTLKPGSYPWPEGLWRRWR